MSEPPPPSSNAAQIDYWNAAAGRAWAQFQEQLDRQIEPLGLEALRQLAPVQGEQIIDIGCGGGQTSLDLAARVGPAGRVVGIDISIPLLEVARRRPAPRTGKPPEFLQADVQSEDFGQATFDAAFSRFGVMFFSDPVAAFANIRASLKPGGRLGFVCWRPLQENPWMRVPLEAALRFLPPLAPQDPMAPGPFAFADASRIHSILTGAGFRSVSVLPFDTAIGGGDLEQTLNLTFRIGPLGAALREHPHLQETAAAAVRDALRAYATPDGLRMPAAVWIVLASN